MRNASCIRFGLLASMTLVLGACASTPSADRDGSNSSTTSPTPTRTYTDRAKGLTVDQVRGGSCPVDSKWESLPPDQVLPLANACVKAKDWHRVEKMGDHLAKRSYVSPWGAYYLALSAESRRDYPRAIWMLELALKKAPNEGILHYEMGRIHWDLGEDAAAIKRLKLASGFNPSLTEAHWVLGQIALNRQDLSEARSYFKKSLENVSDHFPSLVSMAQVEMNSKNFEAARDFLIKAISVNSRSAKARLALAGLLEEHLKNLGEALSSYKQLRQMNVDRKLDEVSSVNFDQKITTLQAAIQQAEAGNKTTSRRPSADGKVAK